MHTLNLIRPIFLNCARCLSSKVRHIPEHRALIVNEFGNPTEVVQLKKSKAEEILPRNLETGQILVEHLAACVNPADIMQIQGKYGIKPPLPSVMGNEGVTRVLATGSDIRHLNPGDLAIGVTTLGYWQSYSVQPGKTFLKLDDALEINAAAQLRVNPCTAFRMMKDFVSLKPGDTLIQNGANSAVGVYVIQLAKHWGVKTINVIRDRPNKSDVVEELKGYGADVVVTEEELNNAEVMATVISQVGKAKLLLNCVSGKNGISCHKYLDHGGYSITYGFMSKQPLIISPMSMFKDHQMKLFWMSKWYEKREKSRPEEISNMLNELAEMFKKGILKPKTSTMLVFEERNVAFTSSNNTKYMFSINK